MKRAVILLPIVLITAALAYGTLLPLEFSDNNIWDMLKGFRELFFVERTRVNWKDLALNVACYTPFGFFLLAVLDRLGRNKFLTFCAAVSAAAVLSVTLEFVQMWLPARVPSVYDTAANIAGAILGAFAVPLASGLLQQRGGAQAPLLITLGALLSMLYLALSLGETVLAVLLGGGSSGSAEAMITLYRGTAADTDFIRGALLHVLFSIPLGIWIAYHLRHSTPARRKLLGILAAGGLAAAVELMQTAVSGLAFELLDPLCGLLGAVIGMLAYDSSLDPQKLFRVNRRLRSPLLVGTVLYTTLLFCLLWYPLQFDFSGGVSEFYSRFSLLPFAVMQDGSYDQALFSILLQPLLFVPLGMLLAGLHLAERRYRGIYATALSVLGYGVLLALLVEVGQIFQTGRVADLTDVALHSAGFTLGALLGACGFEFCIRSYVGENGAYTARSRIGQRNEKVVPRIPFEQTFIVPPRSSTCFLTSASPIPVDFEEPRGFKVSNALKMR